MEEVKHITFQGIELGCTYNKFIEELTKIAPDTSVGESDEPNKVMIYTTFLDAKIEMYVRYVPESKKVWRLEFFSYDWGYTDHYLRFKDMFTKKYGEPRTENFEGTEDSIFDVEGGSITLFWSCEDLEFEYYDTETAKECESI